MQLLFWPLFFLVLLPCSAAAQQPRSSMAMPRISLSGKISSFGDGKPIQGVRLTASLDSSQAVSDSGGNYTLELYMGDSVAAQAIGFRTLLFRAPVYTGRFNYRQDLMMFTDTFIIQVNDFFYKYRNNIEFRQAFRQLRLNDTLQANMRLTMNPVIFAQLRKLLPPDGEEVSRKAMRAWAASFRLAGGQTNYTLVNINGMNVPIPIFGF